MTNAVQIILLGYVLENGSDLLGEGAIWKSLCELLSAKRKSEWQEGSSGRAFQVGGTASVFN